jgi:hypothetical protein
LAGARGGVPSGIVAAAGTAVGVAGATTAAAGAVEEATERILGGECIAVDASACVETVIVAGCAVGVE